MAAFRPVAGHLGNQVAYGLHPLPNSAKRYKTFEHCVPVLLREEQLHRRTALKFYLTSLSCSLSVMSFPRQTNYLVIGIQIATRLPALLHCWRSLRAPLRRIVSLCLALWGKHFVA